MSLMDTSGITDGLLKVVSKSIEAAEKGRDAAESRARELEEQLRQAQEQKISDLQAEIKKLRVENSRLTLKEQLGVDAGAAPAAAAGGGGEPGDTADGGGGGGDDGRAVGQKRLAEVYTWLAGHYLSRYADGIVAEGYDALEYLLQAEEEELEQLISCDAVNMKPPHAKKFRRQVAARRSEAAGTDAAGESAK
jgi:hypothetical protein